MAKLTIHSKQRIQERIDTNLKGKTLFRSALKNGNDIEDFNGSFAQYLESKSKNRRGIKVYKNNIYIYVKNSKRLITVFPVPEKYFSIADAMSKSNKLEEKNKIKDKVIGLLKELDISELKNVDDMYELEGAYVNIESELPDGSRGKILDNLKTYLCCQIAINDTECYGVVSDEEIIVIYKYKNDESESKIVKIVDMMHSVKNS